MLFFSKDIELEEFKEIIKDCGANSKKKVNKQAARHVFYQVL